MRKSKKKKTNSNFNSKYRRQLDYFPINFFPRYFSNTQRSHSNSINWSPCIEYPGRVNFTISQHTFWLLIYLSQVPPKQTFPCLCNKINCFLTNVEIPPLERTLFKKTKKKKRKFHKTYNFSYEDKKNTEPIFLFIAFLLHDEY